MKELYGIDVEEVDESVADCEIGDVIAGKAPGRVNDEEIVHAAGVGMGIEDVIVADVIYRPGAGAGHWPGGRRDQLTGLPSQTACAHGVWCMRLPIES